MFRSSKTYFLILSVFFIGSCFAQNNQGREKVEIKTAKGCKYVEYTSPERVENSTNSKVTWSGKCIDEYIQGDGILTIDRPDGVHEEFQGTYDHGCENGFIKSFSTSATGTVKFVGQYSNCSRTQGKFEFESSVSKDKSYIYEGSFKNGKFFGVGKFTHGNGTELMGNFVDGKIQGNGVIKYADGGAYLGEIKNSLPDGIGKLTYKNGDIFEGNLREGKPNGYGKLIKANSSIIEGYWLSGILQDGAKTTFSGSNVYTGSYNGLLPHGPGIYNFSDGNIYIGSFINGMFDGKGTLQYANGDTYEGDFAKNKRTGRGTYAWKSGKTTSGYFIDGVVDGMATEKFPNGDVINGLYKEGKKEGWWTIKSANGTTAYANFEGGQRVDVDSRSSTEPQNQSSANKAVATMNCNVYAKNMMAGEKPNIMAGPSVGASLLSGILEGARMDLDRKSYFNNCMSNYGF